MTETRATYKTNMTTAEVQKEAGTLLAAVAAEINIRHSSDDLDISTETVRQALDAALAERGLAAVILWRTGAGVGVNLVPQSGDVGQQGRGDEGAGNGPE